MQYIRDMKIKLDEQWDAHQYPYCIKSIQQQPQITFHQPVTYFSGENGSGKSTILEAIAVAYGFNAEGGTKNIMFETKNTHSSLCEHLTLVKGVKKANDGFFLRAESFYNLATNLDELEAEQSGLLRYYGGKSLHTISHGESFLNLVLHRFWGNGIYILDEPEAALSPTGQFTLLKKIYDLAEKDQSQFIIATHSPILLACPHAEIYEFDDQGIHLRQYEETLNYILYHRFMNDPNMLKQILLDE